VLASACWAPRVSRKYGLLGAGRLFKELTIQQSILVLNAIAVGTVRGPNRASLA